MAVFQKGEPRYQVPRALADSLAFRSLPVSAKVLWHDMMMQYRGANNGNINAALSEFKHYGWRSSATLAKALAHLMAHGLIRETRKGGKRAGNLKQCCLYAFTHLPTHANDKLGIQGKEPTHNYRNFDSSTWNGKEKITLQNMKLVASDNEACRVIK
jgi:hypothetical protein